MARIRTVKPALFRHELLYDAEEKYGLPLRLAFIGLFTCCDRKGRFRWRPRELKLDVLPYDNVDFSKVLHALEEAGFIRQYKVEDEVYGCIPSFKNHQVINAREAKSEIPPEVSTEITCEKEEQEYADNSECTDSNNTLHVHARALHEKARGEGEREVEGNILPTPDGVGCRPNDEHPKSDQKLNGANGYGGKSPPCPHQDIIDLYHEILPMCPQVLTWGKQREAHLRQRWREGMSDLDLWRQYFERVKNSQFLTGKARASPNRKPFIANLPWLVKPENFAKVLEGTYD